MQPLTQFVRDRLGDEMSAAEINRRARAVVEAIDAETGNRHAHSARVGQLYHVARQIQHAHNAKAQLVTVHKIIVFLMAVIASSYGLGRAR